MGECSHCARDHQIHFVQSYGPNSVKVADTSGATEIKIAQIRHTCADGLDNTADDTNNTLEDLDTVLQPRGQAKSNICVYLYFFSYLSTGTESLTI